jgi:hypothetical protein
MFNYNIYDTYKIYKIYDPKQHTRTETANTTT